jgi:hypothetical protein
MVTVGFGLLAPRESKLAVYLLGGDFVFFGFLWGWLVGSVAGGIQTILALVGITPTSTWIIGIVVFVACLLVAMYLGYRDLYIKFQLTIDKPTPSSTVVRQPRVRLMATDIAVLIDLESQMKDRHGDSDDSGIERDYRNWIDPDDILNRKCTRCGKPRNQKGGYPCA